MPCGGRDLKTAASGEPSGQCTAGCWKESNCVLRVLLEIVRYLKPGEEDPFTRGRSCVICENRNIYFNQKVYLNKLSRLRNSALTASAQRYGEVVKTVNFVLRKRCSGGRFDCITCVSVWLANLVRFEVGVIS